MKLHSNLIYTIGILLSSLSYIYCTDSQENKWHKKLDGKETFNLQYLMDEEIPAFSVALQSNSSVDTFISNYLCANDPNVQLIAHAIKSNTTLTSLNLRLEVSSTGILHLCNAVQQNTRIKKFGIAFNQTDDLGSKYLADMVKGNSALTNLVTNDAIGLYGVKLLCVAIQKNPFLKKLSICLAHDEVTKEVAHMIEKNTTLTTLNLEASRIGAAGFSQLTYALLGHNNTLTDLNLEHVEFSLSDILNISRMLKYKNMLQKINLSCCKLDSDKIKYIADALKYNTALSDLRLAYNYILETGAKHLADALTKNSTLKHLDLEKSKIGNTGTQYLCDALKNNYAFSNINLTDNGITAVSAPHIFDLLKNNTSLSTLGLGFNFIGNNGARCISEAFKYNSTLKTLGLVDNDIENEGAKHLADALKINSTLSELDLSCNAIGNDGAQYLSEALKNNTAITKLNLEDNNNDEQVQSTLDTRIAFE
jgi:Ran GTPase-activating protein (RanGAP) involved in mRNA processing and transport